MRLSKIGYLNDQIGQGEGVSVSFSFNLNSDFPLSLPSPARGEGFGSPFLDERWQRQRRQVKAAVFQGPSFRRKPESSVFNMIWTPAFAGVTKHCLSQLLNHLGGYLKLTVMGAGKDLQIPLPRREGAGGG